MKVSLILVAVSMMVAVEMSNAACSHSLVDICRNTMRISLIDVKSISQTCRVVDAFLYCVRPCSNPELSKQLTYKLLADKGVNCNETKNVSPESPGAVGSTLPKVIILPKKLCTQSLVNGCLSTLKSSSYPSISAPEGCRVLDNYLQCLQPCGSQDSLKKFAYELLADNGLKCGSAMVTLSGTMLMLMLFTTLRHFF